MAIFDSYVSLPEGTRCYFGIFWYAIVPNFEKLVGWFHFSKSKPTIAWVKKKNMSIHLLFVETFSSIHVWLKSSSKWVWVKIRYPKIMDC